MTIFASTPPINDDPEPYVGPTDNSATKRYPDLGDPRWRRRLAPRATFERPRAHRPNRVLLAYRERETPGGHTHSGAALMWAHFTIWGIYGWDGSICVATDAEVRHAHRVLQRWRRIFDA